MEAPFSKRHGYRPTPKEITIRNSAPEELRMAILQIAVDVGMTPTELREVVCRVLRKRPDPYNWSDYPNVWNEIQELIMDCEWFKVYDIAEAIYSQLPRRLGRVGEEFMEQMNDFFVERGIGWQMVDGRIQTRGPETFEEVVKRAKEGLDTAALPTAKSELHEALQDLSRRPEPDLTGAVQHAMAALECVAREISGDRKATLGDILKKHKEKLNIPKPLDEAVSKSWGYASEMGRHIREGRIPTRRDVELIVGVSATIINYLCHEAD